MMDRLLGPEEGNSIKCLSQGHSDALPHRELKQGFAPFRLLTWRLFQLSRAAASTSDMMIIESLRSFLVLLHDTWYFRFAITV